MSKSGKRRALDARIKSAHDASTIQPSYAGLTRVSKHNRAMVNSLLLLFGRLHLNFVAQ
jgi:hypothetical protein